MSDNGSSFMCDNGSSFTMVSTLNATVENHSDTKKLIEIQSHTLSGAGGK